MGENAGTGGKVIIIAGTADAALMALAKAMGDGDGTALAVVPAKAAREAAALLPIRVPTAVAALTEELAATMARSPAVTVFVATALWALPDDALAVALAPIAAANTVTLLAPLDGQRAVWTALTARAAMALCRDHGAPAWGVAAGMDHRLVAHGLYYDARLAAWQRVLGALCPGTTPTIHAMDGGDVDGAIRRLAEEAGLACPAPRHATRGTGVGIAATVPLGWKAVALAEEIALARPGCARRRRIWSGAIADAAAAMAPDHEGWHAPPPCRMDRDAQDALIWHYRSSNRALVASWGGPDLVEQRIETPETADILAIDDDEIDTVRRHVNARLERRDPEIERPIGVAAGSPGAHQGMAVP
ncbi:MAG: hypothetical protein AAF899_16810 [Pseudomonadota bacterium]